VQWVEREHRSHERAPPDGAGQRVQRAEEEQRVGRVKDEIRKVVAAGVEPEELAVEHVREPGETGAKSPRAPW